MVNNPAVPARCIVVPISGLGLPITQSRPEKSQGVNVRKVFDVVPYVRASLGPWDQPTIGWPNDPTVHSTLSMITALLLIIAFPPYGVVTRSPVDSILKLIYGISSYGARCKPSPFDRKTAICPRVSGASGQ